MTRSLVRAASAMAMPAVLIAAIACSSNNNKPSSPSNTANTGATKVSAPVTSPAAGAASGSVDEVETDNKFSTPKITIKAGQPATVTVSNKGQAVHNWHVLNVKDDAGKDIMTPLQEGGKTSSVTFTISKAGTYDFHCDAHPDEMKGQLVVQ